MTTDPMDDIHAPDLPEYEEGSGNVFADLGLPDPERLLREAPHVQRLVSQAVQEERRVCADIADRVLKEHHVCEAATMIRNCILARSTPPGGSGNG